MHDIVLLPAAVVYPYKHTSLQNCYAISCRITTSDSILLEFAVDDFTSHMLLLNASFA